MSEQATQSSTKSKLKRLAIAGCLFVAGIFLMVSFFSFFFTWQNDQSELLNKSAGDIIFSHADTSDPTEIDDDTLDIQNKGAGLGAFVAKKFIHDWFGLGSFAFVFLCFFFMLYVLKFEFIANANVKKIVFVAISLMIMFSVTFGFFCNDAFDGNIGGCLGYYFSYQLLRNILGTFITGLAIVVADIIYVFCTFKKVLPFVEEKYQQFFCKKETPEEQIEESAAEETVIQNTNQEIPEDFGNNTNVATQQEEIAHEDVISNPQQTEVVETFSNDNEQEIPEIIDNTENQPEEEKDDVVEFSEEQQESQEQDETEAENDDLESVEEDSENFENDDSESLDPNDADEDVSNEIQNELPEDDSIEKIVGNPQKQLEIINTNTGIEDTGAKEMVMQDYDPKAELSHFKQPTVDLLTIYDNDKKEIEVDKDEQLENSNLIERTLLDFGIEIENITAIVGPTITLYEMVLKAGTKISKVQSLEKNIMMGLAAPGIRIIAPIPGKNAIGIEVPNKKRQTVSMYSVLNSKEFMESKMELPVALGKTITNEVYMFDLAKTPHLLVAGSTGQGKSVGLNAIVTSLLYKKHPSQLKFVMVDPKMVEFSIYKGLERHFMAQYPGEEKIILTECDRVINTLNSLVEEMENRYRLLMNANCRNIIEYNDKFIHRHLNPEKGHKYLPYIVIIIDEYGDFMMQAGKEIEAPILRLAQKARAVGMHMILATQQPNAKIVTGNIKANFPARIAFRTASHIDSQIIIGKTGAEGLVGKGDLLISYAGNPIERVQCAFVDTPEVERIVDCIQHQQGYGEPMQLPEVKEKNQDDFAASDSNRGGGELDPIFEEAARAIIASGTGSTSSIQRSFQVGYNRAGRIMDQMARYKIVGAFNGSKAREVLVDTIGLEQILDDLRQKGLLK